MCEFISWVEKRGKIKFLTGTIIQSEKFLEVARLRGIAPEDYNGHGAIRAYYGIDEGDGIDREMTDFSSPANFPPVIAEAIKKGDMRGLGVAKGLLTQPAWAEYKKITQPAWAEYKKITQPAWAEYKKITQQAWAEYKKVEQQAWAEYKKVEQQAWVEYEKVKQSAWVEYEKVKQSAWAEYEKVKQQAFWDLFQDPENRNPLWR